MQATHLIWRQVCHSQKGRGGSWQGEGTLRQRKDRNSQGRPLYTRLIQQQWINTAFTSKLRTRDRSMCHACLTGSSKTQVLRLAWAGKSVPWDATDAGRLRTRSRTVFSRCHILSCWPRSPVPITAVCHRPWCQWPWSPVPITAVCHRPWCQWPQSPVPIIAVCHRPWCQWLWFLNAASGLRSTWAFWLCSWKALWAFSLVFLRSIQLSTMCALWTTFSPRAIWLLCSSRALWTIWRPHSAVLRLLHGSRALWPIRLSCTSEALQTHWLLCCHSDSGALGGSCHCWTLQAIWSFPMRTVRTTDCRLGSCAVSINTCHRHSRRWADIQECLQYRKQPFHPGINHNL